MRCNRRRTLHRFCHARTSGSRNDAPRAFRRCRRPHHRVGNVYDSRLRWPVPSALPAALAGQRIRALTRRSKYLLFAFDRGTMLVHFGMTGSLRLYPKAPPRRPHDHVDWLLDDGATLRYHDPRRFGAILWTTDSPLSHPLLRDLGPEPLADGFDGDTLWTAAACAQRAGQDAADGQHGRRRRGQHLRERGAVPRGHPPDDRRPARVACRAWRDSPTRCARCSPRRSRRAGGRCATTSTATARPAASSSTHYVYGRAGEPCRVCGTPVRARTIGQRNSFWCPQCQA